jgi:major membrane immunogen (membrane-anchored lipoprotein)
MKKRLLISILVALFLIGCGGSSSSSSGDSIEIGTYEDAPVAG